MAMLTAYGALNTTNLSFQLNKRIEKQKAFFNRTEPGDMLLYINLASRGIPYIHRYFYNLLLNSNVVDINNNNKIQEYALNYVTQVKQSLFTFYLIEDDALPAMTDIFFGTGANIGAMIEREVTFSNQTAWCKEKLDINELEKIKFNKDNEWIRFTISLYKKICEYWNEDFCIGGLRYHTPLDAASAIIGGDIFEKMYTNADEIKSLLKKCANWVINYEKYIREQVDQPTGYKAIIGCLIPDDTIWVNGDAIDLISSNHAEIFDIPFTSYLFESVGGGFFHHHSIGLHQISMVSHIKNMVIHHISNDFPAGPDPAKAIIENSDLAEEAIKASIKSPIMIDQFPSSLIYDLLPILKEGRFILNINCVDGDDARQCIEKVEKVNNLR